MPRDFAKQAGTKSKKQKPPLKRKNNSRPETRRLRDFFWGSCFGIFLSVLGFYFIGTTVSEDLIESDEAIVEKVSDSEDDDNWYEE